MSNDRYRNVYVDGCSHFLAASVVDRVPALLEERVCRCVPACWQKQRKRHRVRIEGFVIMPHHVHLVVSGPGDRVRKFVQYSLAETSRGIQRMLEARTVSGDALAGSQLRVFRSSSNGASQGKVWKERARVFPVRRERDLVTKLEYIHNNPVRRGLAQSPANWKWSSYGFYHGGECVFDVDAPALSQPC